MKLLLIFIVFLKWYCGHPLVHVLVIQNVFYFLSCLTFHIYFLICFGTHSLYYETVFYYLIHILFFYLKILLDFIWLLYKFWVLVWQVIVLLLILLHVWSSVLIWAFNHPPSDLIVFLKYIFLLYFICIYWWKLNWGSIKMFLNKWMIWESINFFEVWIRGWIYWIVSFFST